MGHIFLFIKNDLNLMHDFDCPSHTNCLLQSPLVPVAELLHLLQQFVGLVKRAAAEGQAPESDEVGGQVVGRHQRQRVLYQ